LVGYA